MKKLYRSKKDRVIAGILGGMAEYFNMSSVLLRFLYVIAFVFTGFWPMVLIYIIGWFMIPEVPDIEVIASDDIREG